MEELALIPEHLCSVAVQVIANKEGRFSIKANDQYRIEFTLTETDEEPIVTICNIKTRSNITVKKGS